MLLFFIQCRIKSADQTELERHPRSDPGRYLNCIFCHEMIRRTLAYSEITILVEELWKCKVGVAKVLNLVNG